jgi:hypothetical protein
MLMTRQEWKSMLVNTIRYSAEIGRSRNKPLLHLSPAPIVQWRGCDLNYN